MNMTVCQSFVNLQVTSDVYAWDMTVVWVNWHLSDSVFLEFPIQSRSNIPKIAKSYPFDWLYVNKWRCLLYRRNTGMFICFSLSYHISPFYRTVSMSNIRYLKYVHTAEKKLKKKKRKESHQWYSILYCFIAFQYINTFIFFSLSPYIFYFYTILYFM